MAPEECEQTKLKLTNTSLDQAFMDRLAISSRLTVLKAKVRYQLHLTVHVFTLEEFDSPLDLAAKVFQQLRSFRWVQFGLDVRRVIDRKKSF